MFIGQNDFESRAWTYLSLLRKHDLYIVHHSVFPAWTSLSNLIALHCFVLEQKTFHILPLLLRDAVAARRQVLKKKAGRY